MKFRIVLADDHPIFRQGLRMLIDAQPDMEVVGEAENGRATVSLAEKLKPHVMVMDVSMPEMNGLKAAEALQICCPEVRIVTLTRHSDGGYLQQLLDVGVKGYVLKQSDSDEVVRAIRAVARGQTYLDPVVAELAVRTIDRRPSGSPTKKKLSRREQEVLRMVAWGLMTREIADRLQISIKTVEAHKANAMNKLNLVNRVDVIRYALLQGWLQET